ncbi:Mandelate racemase/muconate lactonizing enzyme [Candidatus Rhodobacter oscarellae]|uniref:Mandelate racemase/muconate lactonizing enzyme n=1 Tax=Candidatus Rhodobacter oscarellae TaxID=1675527 RepID=A0A0J9H071_9RHOB|nr:mandelate racemase/muconate lactonizing enzyme family protein [Candidatus Rhodobacter lobularis]KMW59133.1 Mandelate racemase/muconate lactonizing enzyme [Candidatus Rhodobacter lobularis]
MSFRSTITLAQIEVFPIRATGGVSPKMALGTMPTRPALLVRVTDDQGCFGWGEVWANFPPRANIHKAHIIEDVVAAHLTGLSFTDPREVQEALRAKLSVFFLHIGQARVFEHILAGLDTALWDLALRASGESFAAFMGLPSASSRSYATSINASDLETLIPRHSGLGQTHFKLKIGFAEHGNAEIVERAARLCPLGARIMVDSNQSWSLDEAKASLHAIEPFDPYFAEECLRADAPASEWEDLARSTDIALAGGENIYGIADFLTMTRAGMRVLQPDVAKWGGVSGALDLAAQVPEDVMIWPHFMGSAVGQIAALSISAAVGRNSACEVDVNENALRTELCGDVIRIESGCVALPEAPGLVVPPSPDALDRFAEPPA